MTPDRPHPGRLDALPAEREALQAGRRVEPLPRRVQRRRRSSWRSTARWSPAAASASRARATSASNPKAPSATSATSASRSCPSTNPPAGRDRAARRRLQVALHRPRPRRLETGPGPRRALAAEGLDARLRRQERGRRTRTSGREKEYGDFSSSATGGCTGKPKKTNAPGHPAQRRRRERGRRHGKKRSRCRTPATAASTCAAASKSQVNIWCWPVGSGEVYGYRTDPNDAGRGPRRRHAESARPTSRSASGTASSSP